VEEWIRTLKRRIIMTTQFSFTKYENRLLPVFRERISKAESTEDVKKFFVYTTKELLEDIFEGKMEFEYEDFELIQGRAPYYKLSGRVRASKAFRAVWNDSDLSRVIYRLAESAMRRCVRLEKHQEKTESKIRM
jgi:hypothetical protein